MKIGFRRQSLLLILLPALFLTAWESDAQGSAGSGASIELRHLINMPTAGMIPHGNLALDMEFYAADGVLARTSIGLFDRFLLGLSYGGTKIIGTEKPNWNKSPGFSLKLRILDETMVAPAIALGFDSQGKGEYVDRFDRYTIKSPGFYGVVSKNYAALGMLSIHGGVNYSLENGDGDKTPDAFGGIEKSVGPFISAVAEYDFALNDSHNDALGRGRGYLSLGGRISVGNGLTIGVNLEDLFRNQQDVSFSSRTVVLEYVKPL